jgi:hypothetical protein
VSLRPAVPPLGLIVVVALAGCGGGDAPARTPAARPTATASPKPNPKPRRTRVRAPSCPGEVPDCARVSGRIVYVERVDPDGDGDLHVVVTDPRGVTLPGLTSIDVSKALRPRRDPRVGERAAAMGPVQTGSFDQSQIHALVFRTRR